MASGNNNDFLEGNKMFFEYFESTFSPDMRTPAMLHGSFSEAVMRSIGQPLPKPLLIYIVEENNYNNEIFFMQNICNDIVCDYLVNADWSIWPVFASDKNARMELLMRINGVLTEAVNPNMMKGPIMIMILREHLRNHVAALMCSDDPMVIVDQLFDQGEMYKTHIEMTQQIIQSKRDKRAFENEQKQIRVQQEKDDVEEKERMFEAEKIRSCKENVEKLKEVERENLIQYAKAQIKESVPSKENFLFKLRLPSGLTVSKEFNEYDSANDVIYFVESHGYVRDEIKILFPRPVGNLCDMSNFDTELKNLGMTKREMINVQMKK
jgi:hypothetical protein